MNDYQEHLDFAKELAYEAGSIMKKYFLADELGLQIKEDKTPLTLADTEINSLVISRVKERYPDHGILGEEESYGLERDKLWVVDPLDGTPFFARGVPIFVFSLALVIKGECCLGVIYDPNIDKTYWATIGGGAFENGQKLSLGTHDPKGTLVISSWVTGEGHQSFIDNREIDGKLAYAYGQAGNILSFDLAIAHALALVASGRFDACLTSVRNPWDVAAGSLIAKEAGATVTDIFGDEIREWDKDVRGLMVAAPEIHKKLIAITAPILKDYK